MNQPIQVGGKTVTFTGASSAPATVQCVSTNSEGLQQYVLTNAGSVDVFVSYSADSGQATAQAVIPTSTSQFGYWLLARSQVTISGPANAYFTGVTASSTAVVYVTPGTGE